MRMRYFVGASLLAMANATPVFAQEAPPQAATEDEDVGAFGADIVVTAQRQSQRLQDVPIAVSAFSAESLEAQQIENSSDLQLTLPNVTFTKTNFTSASFTIRGIGDLCVGVTCDSATAIHLNGAPLFGTRLFETEFFDLERIEVLRGPQGTLFGRNATSGVVNVVAASADPSGFAAAGEFEYGNYDSYKLRGMVNVPLGDNAAVRLAGFYLNRDGFTRNIFNNTRLDDRNLYAVRGSFRWEPSDSTTLDLSGYYFRENDSRLRIQKQRCQRDPTGVLGCLNGRRDAGVTNANTTLAGLLTSREFFAIRGLPTAFALGSIYGTDIFAGAVSPEDVRTVSTDSPSNYFTEEYNIQGRLDHEFANGIAVQLTGNYQHVVVDSSQDYNLSVGNRAGYLPGLSALAATAAGAPPLSTYLRPVASALIPGGPGGPLCTSAAEFSQTGVFGGNAVCGTTPLDFDRSNQTQSSWSGELIVSSDWDGAFNFLLGGIYAESSVTENSYFVNSFGLDYASGILGAFTALSNGLPPSYLGSPAFRNNTDDFTLRSYGVFGEAYVQLNDALKLTLGLRYNNDDKEVTARSTLLNFLVPYGTTNIFASPFAATFDADEGRAGAQPFQIRNSQFDEFTGRAVLDWQITPDNLIYASYSRGYKSGGINPPLQAIFAVDEAFRPEIVNAFEIGSKNQFGALQLNLTGFYYQYQDLQLSRIVARTSVNDNVDANIWGLEAEAIITPTRELAINLNASYLNTEVSQDRFLSNPRDPGGGRADAVIIKDITNGSNCAVRSTSGSVAGVNGFVNQTNTLINAGLITGVSAGAGLQPTTAFPADGGIASRGAFSICQVLTATATAFGASFGGVEVLSAGVPVNIRGNALPQAPTYKFSAGIQYRIETASDISITPRLDIAYTGDSQGSIFNSPINEIDGFTQVNAQINVDGPDRRWYARAFVSNLFNSDSTTGLYVTDQSSGLFTNIFTLEPRRYGVAVGFRF